MESFVAVVNPTPLKKAEPRVVQHDYSEIQAAARSFIRASYDVAARTPENMRHWQWVDNLSADAALSPEVRKTVREQARYEVLQNNSYGIGIANTLIHDTIGTGPRLQTQTLNPADNKIVDTEFGYWAKAVNLREKLSTLRMAKMIDGEAIARFTTNLLSGEPVSVDLLLIECDQLTSPDAREDSPIYVDGVHLDRFGFPWAYDILNEHPGSNNAWSARSGSYNTYGYQQVLHYFRKDRPGQHRGISEFVAALPLFALLRRYTLAVTTCAETAANVSQVIETDTPLPDDEGLQKEYAIATFGKFLDTVPINRNSAMVLPNQWKLKQFVAEQPTTTYAMFKTELINEIARVINMPRNKATADSAGYNYASGRLDHLSYQRSVAVEQAAIGDEILDRIFAEWLVEAALMGIIPKRLANYVMQYDAQYGRRGLASRIPHAWYWDGFEEADREAAANAEKTQLASGTNHRAAIYAARGQDIDVEDEKAAEGLGVTVQQYRQMVASSIFTNGNAFAQPSEGDTGTAEETEDAKQKSATT